MIQQLIEKYNAEEVCGRLIAVVDGKREYIANKEAGGGYTLTAVGVALEQKAQEEAEAAAVAAAAPKRKKKVAAEQEPEREKKVAAEQEPEPAESDLMVGVTE